MQKKCVGISDIEWDCSKTDREDCGLPLEINISDIPNEIIFECKENKDCDSLIDYLSDKYGFCISSYLTSDDLLAIIEDNCNLYKVNLTIRDEMPLNHYSDKEGIKEVEDVGLEYDDTETFYDNLNLGEFELEDSKIKGNYVQIDAIATVEIVARTEKEATDKADELFEDDYENIDFGDMEDPQSGFPQIIETFQYKNEDRKNFERDM